MKIFNTRVDNITKLELREFIKSSLSGSKKIKISKINAEFLQRTLNYDDFRNIINSSDVNLVDGRGVLWAARYLSLPMSRNRVFAPIQAIYQMIYSGLAIVFKPDFIKTPIKEAIPGVDAFDIMMKSAMEVGAGVYIFGASSDTLKIALQKIKKEYPKLIISGHMDGYGFNKKNSNIDPVAEINKTKAKLLIVALGSPTQEKWIYDNIDSLINIRVAVGEGGTLDRIANPRQKSPRFINEIGLEWLWRLFFNKSKTSTRGRFKRFVNSVPMFIFEIVKWKVIYGHTKK